MSIVCTMKRDQLALPKLNLCKATSSTSTSSRNPLLVKDNYITKQNYNNNNILIPVKRTTTPKLVRMTAVSCERNVLKQQQQQQRQQQQRHKHHQQQRIMVAEFVARQHSTGSPVNGETPNQRHSHSDMPDTTVTIGSKNPSATAALQMNSLQQQQLQHQVRMACLSPVLSLNGNSNGPLNVHTGSNCSNMVLHEPLSPQSSDGGHSLSEHVHLMNSNSSSSNGKYGCGSGSASPNGSSGGGYDLQHMTKAQQQQHKELFTQRKQREFIPDNKKDDSYWDRRRRNNEAAKRSREKRRYNDMVLEQRVVELTKENHVLKAQLDAIRDKFNISGENLVSVEQIMASLPTSEQVLSITKRVKINGGGASPAVTESMGVAVVPSIVYTGATTSQTEQSPLAPPPLKQQQPQQAPMGKTAKLVGHMAGLPHMHPGGHHSVQQFVQQASPTQPYSGGQLLSPTVSTTTGSTGSPDLSTSPFHLQEPQSQPQPHQPHLHPHLHHPQQPATSSASLLQNPMPIYGSQSQGLPQAHHRHQLQVLKAFNRNVGVSGDDIDHLRKVVAVVGAMTASSGAGGVDAANGGLYRPVTPTRAPTPSALYGNGHGHKSHPYNYSGVITAKDHAPCSSSSVTHDLSHAHHHLSLCQRSASLTPPNTVTGAVDAVVSSSLSMLSSGSISDGSPLYSDTCAAVAASVLNLSRRTSSPSYDLLLSSSSLVNSSSHSSSVCSGAVSGDDEHDALDEAAAIAKASSNSVDVGIAGVAAGDALNPNNNAGTNINSNGNNDSNNSLPLKLRHKSHLGDKDAAATALLALQHIKQEPLSSRLSPRSWATNDGDNSSDERDSGISIVSNEWTARFQRSKHVLPETSSLLVDTVGDIGGVSPSERDHMLKSQLARLESEVANIKNMMIMTTNGAGSATTPSASGFVATAQ